MPAGPNPLALACLLAQIRSTEAVPLAPGGTLGPPAPSEPQPVGGTVLFTENVSFSSAVLQGNLISKVITGDASNPFGGLTFTYELQLASSSIHDASQLSISRFDRFLTDVSFNALVAGDIPPSYISRSIEGGGSGEVMRFHFGDFGQPPFNPGSESALLVVQTSALNYQLSSASVIDGVAAANITSLAPLAVPEPTAAGLLVLGLLIARRFRR